MAAILSDQDGDFHAEDLVKIRRRVRKEGLWVVVMKTSSD